MRGTARPAPTSVLNMCSGCQVDLGATASSVFVFITLVTVLLVGMQLCLYLNIDAATKLALRKFVDLTSSVQSGVQGLSEEVAALRGRVGDMERALLANVTWQVREVLARLPPA